MKKDPQRLMKYRCTIETNKKAERGGRSELGEYTAEYPLNTHLPHMAKGIAEDSEGHLSHPRPRALMLLRRGGPLGRFWGLGLMTTAEKKKANIKAKRLDFCSPKPRRAC